MHLIIHQCIADASTNSGRATVWELVYIFVGEYMPSGIVGLVVLLLVGKDIDVSGLGEFIIHDGCFGDGIKLVVE